MKASGQRKNKQPDYNQFLNHSQGLLKFSLNRFSSFNTDVCQWLQITYLRPTKDPLLILYIYCSSKCALMMRCTTAAMERSSSRVTCSNCSFSMSVTKVTIRCGRARFAAVLGLPRFDVPVVEVFFIVYPSLRFAITCKLLRAK